MGEIEDICIKSARICDELSLYLQLFCSLMTYLRSDFLLIITYQLHVLLTTQWVTIWMNRAAALTTKSEAIIFPCHFHILQHGICAKFKTNIMLLDSTWSTALELFVVIQDSTILSHITESRTKHGKLQPLDIINENLHHKFQSDDAMQ